MAYYPFNGNANDESGNGYISSTFGNVSLNNDRFGNANSSYFFDGSGDYIDTKTSFDYENRSISIWFKIESLPSNDIKMIYSMDSDQLIYGNTKMYVNSAGTISIGPGGGSGIAINNIELSKWHHMVVIRGSTESYIYFNGDLFSTGNVGTYGSNAARYKNLVMGTDRTRTRRWFHGSIDDLAIYNRVLNADEVNQLYIEGLPSCTDGIQNGDETDVDCGGSCDPCIILGCTDLSAHNYDSLATSDDGSCLTCSDGIQNGDETAVDCGGSCPPCDTMGTGSGSSLWTLHENGNDIFYSDGNVGVGTSLPEDNLHVHSDVISHLQVSGWQAKALFNVNDEDITSLVGSYSKSLSPTYTFLGNELAGSGIFLTKGSDLKRMLVGTKDNVPIIFGTNDLEKVRIDENGNVGIGTQSPNATLQIGDSDHSGTPNSEVEIKRLSLAPVTHSGSDWFFTVRDNNPNANLDIGYHVNTALTLRNDGNVGIGTQTPHEKASIRSNVYSKASNSIELPLTVNRVNSDVQGLLLGVDLNHNSVIASNNAGMRLGRYYGNNDVFYEYMQITNNGDVGIGTTTPLSKLSVNGKILAQEVKVQSDINVPDYVFAKGYGLMSLSALQKYIDSQGHLPEIPSAIEIKMNGFELGDMDMRLLKKIEELTLYTIEQEKRLDSQEDLIHTLLQRIECLEE